MKRVAVAPLSEEVLPRNGELGRRGGVGRRGEENAPRVQPPVGVALVVLAAFVGEHGVGDPLAIDLGEQAWCEGELVALPGESERLELTEREQGQRIAAMAGAEIVRAIEGAYVLDEALLLAVGIGRRLVGEFLSLRDGGIQRGEIESRTGSKPEARHLEASAFARQRRPVAVLIVDRVGETALGAGDVDRRLLALFRGRQRRVGLATAVTDSCRPERVAKVVHLKRQGMADAWIGGLAFVVIADGLARVREEHRMGLPAFGCSMRRVKFCSVTA